MLIDITLKITPKMVIDASGNEKRAISGHLGTHFDIMDKEFPLDYTTCDGIVFDVSEIKEREIDIHDIDLNIIREKMFVAFYTGYIEKVEYGSKEYFTNHPEFSKELINKLLEKQIAIIGIDFAGVRRGKEHPITDQHCANKNVFIIENLCNLKTLLSNTSDNTFIANTYPMNFTDMTGLPCRVIAKI